jgi:vitamin B12 transporter
MRTPRYRRQPAPCLLYSVLTCGFIVFASAPARAAGRVTGTVADPSGRPLPRALIRATDASGREIVHAFTDERGRFDLSPDAVDGCRVEASLAGFAAASTACGADLRIVLALAPIAESVVVTATRTDTPTQQAAASVTTFTAEDLDARKTALAADVLRAAPATMLVRSGGVGSLTSLFVRGGESSHNKVLIDGIPINEPGGTFYFDNLTTENIERIELVRGPQSALFGSDAMASVVQLFTKRAGSSPAGSVTLEGGSFGTFRASGAASARHGAFDYSVGAAHLTTDNEVPNSDFDNTTVSGAAGRAFESATLRFVGRGEFGRAGSPGPSAFGRPDLDAFGTRHSGVAGAVFDHQATTRVRQQASYSIAVSNQQSTNLVLDPPYVASFDGHVAPFETSDFLYDTRNNLHRHRLSYQADVRVANGEYGSHLLTILSDWDGERGTLSDRLEGTTIEASRNNLGVSVQHQAVWRAVTVTAGGRVEHNDSFGTAFVPRASAAFVMREGGDRQTFGATIVHVAAGSGIKEPTILQSFSPSPYFRGNPALDPERSRSVEIGFDQRLASDRARIGFTWFDARYEDLISLRTTNPETFESQYFNIGRSRARGAEVTLDVAPASGIRGRAGYTFLDSAILESTSPDSVVFQPGQPLFRRPRHSGFTELRWSRGPFAASAVGIVVGRYVDSDFSAFYPPLTENPGYTTWDARFSYRLTSHVSALMAADNLADAHYMEPLGYPALGRAVRVGAHVGF